MMRFTTHPKIETDMYGGGHFSWKKYIDSYLFHPNGTVDFVRTILAASSKREPIGEPRTILSGPITKNDGDNRISIHLVRSDKPKGLKVTAKLVDGELLCHVYSEFTETLFSELFILEGDLVPFANAVDDIKAERAELEQEPPTVVEPTPSPVIPIQRPPVATLEVGELVTPTKFKNNMDKINRELRQMGGRTNTVKLSEITAEQRQFLTALFSGPLDALRQFALDDLNIFYEVEVAAKTKRIRPKIHQITLPAKIGDKWEINICESWEGALIVFHLNGWNLLDKTLVG